MKTKNKFHNFIIKFRMVKKISSGVYCWLPLGIKIIKNISNVIKNNFNVIGAQELHLSYLQPFILWKKSGRIKKKIIQELNIFYVKNYNSKYILSPSGEEMITKLYSMFLQSYQELGFVLYQINWKFRNEIRVGDGVSRTREFLMFDAYSFDKNKNTALIKYENIFSSYLKIFQDLNIKIIPIITNGKSMGGNYNHEFHVLLNEGRDIIYYDKNVVQYLDNKNNFSLHSFQKFYSSKKNKYYNKTRYNMVTSNSIEVGHMFYLGKKYSESLNCQYQNKKKKKKFSEMGCYGIGISRLISVLIKIITKNKKIMWPTKIKPFKIGIISVNTDNTWCNNIAHYIYEEIYKHLGATIIFDDTNKTIKKKIKYVDLMGISLLIITRKKSIMSLKIEVKNQITGLVNYITIDNLIKYVLCFKF